MFLKLYYKKNFLQMIKITHELIRIIELFKEKNIRVLSLKGPPLAEIIYNDISLRTSVDLDFLVSVNDINTVEKLLSREGYKYIHISYKLSQRE